MTPFPQPTSARSGTSVSGPSGTPPQQGEPQTLDAIYPLPKHTQPSRPIICRTAGGSCGCKGQCPPEEAKP